MTIQNKIDSNATSLSFAEELSPKTLPGTPTWYQLEPNTYSDFGGKIKTVARNPINQSRQRKKGSVTDLDANGGFNHDLTFSVLTRLLQGYFFADIREKKTTAPMNSAATAITSVSAGTTYNAAANLNGFLSGALVFASGFSNAGNNGLKVLSAASTATTASVAAGLVVEAAPPAAAKLVCVGQEFAVGTMDIQLSGSLVVLARTSGVFDCTTLGLIPGEWVYVGDDTAGNSFVTNVPGFARVQSVTATGITFDKVSWTPSAEVGTGKSIHIFFGSVLKNETGALIKRRTYQLERQLGNDSNGVMSEYVVGAVPDELTMNIKQAEKITVDAKFVGLDNVQFTGLQGIKAGNRPTLTSESAFNTSSDFSRIQLSLANTGVAAQSPLYAFCTDVQLVIKNHISANKAVGTLGGFDASSGTFDVSGKITAYFGDIGAVQAVRNNSDITLDFAIIKQNVGLIFDIPLIALGDGLLKVEQDKPITLPLDADAAQSTFGHTLLLGSFAYLPTNAG